MMKPNRRSPVSEDLHAIQRSGEHEPFTQKTSSSEASFSARGVHARHDTGPGGQNQAAFLLASGQNASGDRITTQAQGGQGESRIFCRERLADRLNHLFRSCLVWCFGNARLLKTAEPS